MSQGALILGLSNQELTGCVFGAQCDQTGPQSFPLVGSSHAEVELELLSAPETLKPPDLQENQRPAGHRGVHCAVFLCL